MAGEFTSLRWTPNDSLLAAIIKPGAHCVDSLAAQLGFASLDQLPGHLSQAELFG